jgi:hypothetical protein
MILEQICAEQQRANRQAALFAEARRATAPGRIRSTLATTFRDLTFRIKGQTTVTDPSRIVTQG